MTIPEQRRPEPQPPTDDTLAADIDTIINPDPGDDDE